MDRIKNEDMLSKFLLSTLPETGSATVFKLLDHFGTEDEAVSAAKKGDPVFEKIIGSKRISSVIEYIRRDEYISAYEKMKALGISFVTCDDDDFPQRLRFIEHKPYALFYKGSLPDEGAMSVAIIGARTCSAYGEYIASSFGEYLGSHGISIISGMARGIDGIAQRGAIRGNGRTYAVLGSGVDICYPLSNRGLYDEIPQRGGLLSIFPPGKNPVKRQFPIRNMIVSALSDVVLVIEARGTSGTANTVENAISQGKDVYAVPGRITDRLSDGCNLLIKNGAGVALSPEDMLRELAVRKDRRTIPCPIKQPVRDPLGGTEKGKEKSEKKSVIDHVDIAPRSSEEIYLRLLKKDKTVTLGKVTEELIRLSIDGSVKQVGSGYFMLNNSIEGGNL